MKRRAIGIVALLMLMSGGTFSFGQVSKEQRRERRELVRESRQELNAKATKAARKEAKALAKQGWKAAPGALPVEKQLDRSYEMQYQYDKEGYPLFIMAEAMSTGGNYDAAKMQALEIAKQNLAGQIQNELTALIENTVSNEQLDKGTAASITRSVMAGKNLIMQRLGRIIPVVEVYRDLDGKNREVMVRIACNQEMARDAAKNAIRKDLEERGDSLHQRLDKIFGW